MNFQILQESKEETFAQKPFIFSWSFDPWTYGHESVVHDLFEIFPEAYLIILVAKNPKKQYLFTLEQRKNLIETALQKYWEKIKIEIYDGVVTQYAYLHQARAIIKWIRDEKDSAYEIEIARANTYFSWKVHTLLLPQLDTQVSEIRSSVTKVLFDYGADTTWLISPMIREALRMKKRRQFLVGITGGTGSGKTTLSRKLEEYSREKELPIYHIELDTIVYELYQKPETPLQRNIRSQMLQLFSREIIDADDTLNRKILADIIFSDTVKKQQLEKILGEAFLYMLSQKVQSITTPGIILLDWALFVEYQKTDVCDENMILMWVPENMQRERILSRDMLSPEQADARIQHQLSFSQRKEYLLSRKQFHPQQFFYHIEWQEFSLEDIYKSIAGRYLALQQSFQ